VPPTRQRLAEQFKYTVPYGFAIITWTLATNLHQYVVSYLYDPAMFAVYAVGCLQLPILSMVFETISDVTLVRLTELRQQGGRMESVRLIGHSVTKLALVLFPAYVWLTISARDVLVLLYTERFLPAVDIFTVFLITLPLAALELDYVARAFADTRFILQINIMRLFVTAALLAMLVPSLGLIGAVGAFVLGIALSKLLTLYKLSTLYEVPVRQILPWIDLGKVLAIAWAAGLAGLAAPAMIGSIVPAIVGSAVSAAVASASLPVRLVASASVFLPVYATLIWSSGVLHAEEKQWMAGQARKFKGSVTAWFTMRRPAAAEDR
jgi:O-antigen/teichoic acid export membrane protein